MFKKYSERGFTVAQVAEKHGWTDPMVWSLVRGRIPARLIAHILFYFSKQNDLILDPMAAQRFSAVIVSAMQKKRILGVKQVCDNPETTGIGRKSEGVW